MRRITSKDIPQADKLVSVLQTVIAVGRGSHSDIEIANQIPGIEGDARQGRYYRNAAVKLGFISNSHNHAELNHKGIELLNNPVLTNPLFISSVLSLEVYQKLLPYLEIHTEGLTRNDIMNYLISISDPSMGQSMIPRRISTIIAWLKVMGLLIEDTQRNFKLNNNIYSLIPIFEIEDIDQPIFPITGDLIEFETIANRSESAKKQIEFYIDQSKNERSNQAHTELVNLVANRISNNGGLPKSNKFIDLAVRFDRDFIFEMKSTTEENIKSQIRKGISQLYEYRYLHKKPDAELILVIEQPLNESIYWMHEYMENDRDIHLVWDGNNNLYGSEKAIRELDFLGLMQPH